MSKESVSPNDAASTTDAFLSSMSFARVRRGGTATDGEGDGNFDGWTNIGCDCDECGTSQVPAPIREAIHRYKRRKLEMGTFKRTQDRSLVKRGNRPSTINIAVWNWAMPDDAEPLLEFGNSHRLIWIKRLPGKLYTIGEGIIGSEMEEKKRRVMPWEASGIYFVPSTGGKAVGWVHKNGLDTSSGSDAGGGSNELSKGAGGGIAEILIAKVPSDCLDADKDDSHEDNNGTDYPPWINSLITLCRKYANQSTNMEGGFVVVSDEDAETFKKIVS